MTPHRHWFNTYKPHVVPIRLANNQIIHSARIGSVLFKPTVNGKPGQLLEFHRVLHVPELRNNLLSVLYLTCHKSYVVTIRKNKLHFHRHGALLFTATANSNNAAFLDGEVVPMSHFAGAVSTCPMDWSLWHRRFAHLNHNNVRKLHSQQLVNGMVLKSATLPDPVCEPCIAGKQHRSNVSRLATHRSSKLLQLVHSDVHGPLPVRSRNHYRYWISFIDDATRFWAILPLKDKAGAFAAFKQFKAYAENQLDCKLKALRDDKGGEYMSGAFESFCSAHCEGRTTPKWCCRAS